MSIHFKKFAQNVASNWLAAVVNMLVPFFLTPFVVRHLGEVAYGVWILAVSTVAYFNLLDLGLRSAVIRFVSKSATRGEHEDAQKAIGAALWFRLLIGGAVALASFGLAFAFPHIFKLPPDLRRSAMLTVFLCTMGVAVTLISGVYGGVLSALNRFDLLSGIGITQTAVRAVGVVVILYLHHGLVALALWELSVIVLTGIATLIAAIKVYPHCRFRPRNPEMAVLKSIWSYSFKTFIIIIAVQIVFYTDNIVVGAFLSVAAVSFYSIAGSLAMYSIQISTAMGSTFIPIASGFEATGRNDDIRRLLIRGTQAALGLMLPIGVALLIRGKTFIGLWMGHDFADPSGGVLEILMISQFFTIANATAAQVAYGVDKHKSVATWAAIEAALNLVLSIVLVKTMGLDGVALGTLISHALIHLIFWPRYVKKELHVSVGIYLWQGWMKITVCALPYALCCILAERYWPARSLVGFFAQILATLPAYLVVTWLVFRKEAVAFISKWRASRPQTTPLAS